MSTDQIVENKLTPLTAEQEAQQAQQKLKELEDKNLSEAGQEIQAILDKRGLVLTPTVRFVGSTIDTGVVLQVKNKQ